MTFLDLYHQYRKLVEDANNGADNTTFDGKGFEEHKRERRKFEDVLLGFPVSFDSLRCWMVDVSIKSDSCPSEEMIGAMVGGLGVGDHSYVDAGGGLVSEVRKLMTKYYLTDSGCGCGMVDLGCHCTEKGARDLVNELHSKFSKAIEVGMMKVTRKPWPLRLVDETQPA
jgi:hypothetical protein